MGARRACETADRWSGLADRLSETERRNAAALAWNFCQLTEKPEVWKPVVEALQMNESPVFRQLRNEGRPEMQRKNLAHVLRLKLTGEPLAAAIARLEKQNDLDILSRWFELSLTQPPERILDELEG